MTETPAPEEVVDEMLLEEGDDETFFQNTTASPEEGEIVLGEEEEEIFFQNMTSSPEEEENEALEEVFPVDVIEQEQPPTQEETTAEAESKPEEKVEEEAKSGSEDEDEKEEGEGEPQETEDPESTAKEVEAGETLAPAPAPEDDEEADDKLEQEYLTSNNQDIPPSEHPSDDSETFTLPFSDFEDDYDVAGHNNGEFNIVVNGDDTASVAVAGRATSASSSLSLSEDGGEGDYIPFWPVLIVSCTVFLCAIFLLGILCCRRAHKRGRGCGYGGGGDQSPFLRSNFQDEEISV